MELTEAEVNRDAHNRVGNVYKLGNGRVSLDSSFTSFVRLLLVARIFPLARGGGDRLRDGITIRRLSLAAVDLLMSISDQHLL